MNNFSLLFYKNLNYEKISTINWLIGLINQYEKLFLLALKGLAEVSEYGFAFG